MRYQFQSVAPGDMLLEDFRPKSARTHMQFGLIDWEWGKDLQYQQMFVIIKCEFHLHVVMIFPSSRRATRRWIYELCRNPYVISTTRGTIRKIHVRQGVTRPIWKHYARIVKNIEVKRNVLRVVIDNSFWAPYIGFRCRPALRLNFLKIIIIFGWLSVMLLGLFRLIDDLGNKKQRSQHQR